MQQINATQMAELRKVLAMYGLDVKKVSKPKIADWITEQERKVRSVSLKSQSAFWKAQQLRNLKIRRQISPEYEAFITRNNALQERINNLN